MKAWWWAHQQALGTSIRSLFRQPFALMMTLLVIGVALAIPALLWVLISNGEKIVANMPVTPQLTVMLKPEVRLANVGPLIADLKARPGVQVETVDRDAAFQDLIKRGQLGELGDALPDNPLPDAIVVKFDDINAPAQLLPVLQQKPEVAEVIHDAAWVERLAAFAHLGRTIVIWIGGLLGVGLLVIMANTVRLQILLRKDEIEVSQLIGATNRYIRRPFLYFAALQGLLGGAVAWGVVEFAVIQLHEPVTQLAHLYGTDLALSGMPVLEGLILLVSVMLISWLGAWIAVGRHLKAFMPK
ncbi:permease-like cell division protein FtsX [Leeia sp. TBRC 13508]|uniref:Cell division protein FtsX n=1 Tax=Leeia speluncae TaxID=2884804 RepID=A0ABS8D4U9_9NEIS|nr:permease-like cell division protein FtsX [Leeia speluncae]MCB6183239.1 permease-like cell division protein FtsX [Leeia speluncae]